MSKTEYERVASNEDETLESGSGTPSAASALTSRRAVWFCAITAASLLVLLIGTLIHFSQPKVWSDCGGTPAIARSRGCSFDTLSFAWQTKECYDRNNTETFRLHNGTWTYFYDHDGHEMPEEVAMAGETDVWVLPKFHFTHCTYMWRQLHRAYTVRGYIDAHLDNWHHTLHCQKMLLNEGKYGGSLPMTANTVGRIIYPECRKIAGFQSSLDRHEGYGKHE